MISEVFINRPILAIVIAIAILLGGVIAMLDLPVAQLPEVVPPQIVIGTSYTGADAATIEQSVATPLEQQMNGVDNMIYMQSTNANDGSMALTGLPICIRTRISIRSRAKSPFAGAAESAEYVRIFDLRHAIDRLPGSRIRLLANKVTIFVSRHTRISRQRPAFARGGRREVRRSAQHYAMRILSSPTSLATWVGRKGVVARRSGAASSSGGQ